MNEKPSKLALSLIGQQRADSMRYQFISNEKRPNFVFVFDQTTKQVVLELTQEHARMIYLMYKNLHARQPFAGDEFMYGHVMGVTLALLHAEHYPVTERIQENGVTYIKVTDRTSGHTTKTRVKDASDEAAAVEVAKKVDPNFEKFNDDDEGGVLVPA